MPQEMRADTASDEALAANEGDDRWIGARLRDLRKHKGLSIQELGAAAKLSIGMISQIERGLSTPSLRSLRLLAHALEVPVSYFFGAQSASALQHIVRRNQRRRLKVPEVGVVQELLSPQAPGTVEIYEVILEPGGSSGPNVISHDGEKAGLVCEGTLHLTIGPDAHVLEDGDAFRFPSTIEHRFDNPGDKPVRFVWVVTTPRRKPRLVGR